ncbi:MAG: pyridoxal-phosphate dependent enzyme, partial [Candidatus Heimdallarchaeota archaeon]|nr:pyridoxal-phosphate dependent enzyme [Candidatus Heimdallarchaeota archaeon]
MVVKMFKEVELTYQRIQKVVNHTPVMTSTILNKKVNAKCFIKCENFQKTGSFKFRGALNTLSL